MSGINLIRQARQILSDEEKWTQEECARDDFDKPVSTGSQKAVSFDIVGALQRVADMRTKQGCDDYYAAILLLKRWLPKGSDLFSFNDDHGHAEVLALLDRAAGAAIEPHHESFQPVPMSVTAIMRRVSPYRRAAA